MGKLTAAERNALPDAAFLGPNRTYPCNDEEHCRKALQLSPRGEKAGNISPSTAGKIQSAARRKLQGG